MRQIEASVEIRRPRQVVFDFLLHLENAVGMDPDIESIRKTSEGPPGTGTEFVVRQRIPPFGRMTDGISRFTAVNPPSTLVIEAELGPIKPTGRFEFEEVDGGTWVRVAVDVNVEGFLRALSPLIARKAQRLWEARLRRMKRILES